MTDFRRDTLGRTTKILLDSGKAASVDEATALLHDFTLQVDVQVGGPLDLTAQAALLTAVNTGVRAFKGGVHVRVKQESPLQLPWARGLSISDAVGAFGGATVPQLKSGLPTLIIGATTPESTFDDALYLTWAGWVGAAVSNYGERLSGDGIVLSGVAAAALGVAELFQRELGSPIAGRRSVGLSLWDPGSDWRTTGSHGEDLTFLPASLWLLGLGHLGQAYAWSLGCLPYPVAHQPHIWLVDTDIFVDANLDTGLLTDGDSCGHLKTRVVDRRLSDLGFVTSIVERLYDETLVADPKEPGIALAGFDKPEPRRVVEESFQYIVDAGLGHGPFDYLDILVHTFPGNEPAAIAFPDSEPSVARALPAAYEHAVGDAIGRGDNEADARCGVVDVHGASVGAAFVGSLAGALVVADVLRMLHGGPELSVVNVDLADPENVNSVSVRVARTIVNFGFIDTE